MSDDLEFSGLAALKAAPWLANPATQQVFAAIEAAGFQARAVGGCVRNTLMGQRVADIDIATTALPQAIVEVARTAGFSCHPTGIEHGTVTVVCRGEAFEVTTLRRDVETMGRRAVVAFTTDWSEDAQRRDFTMNALYCDRRGELLDPLGGFGDLSARRVVFIGDARERIREDFLRILRFFRFFAIYAVSDPDEAGLAACVEMRNGIGLLSAERIRVEMLKILAARRGLEAIGLMDQTGILALSLGRAGDFPGSFGARRITALERLAAIEQSLGRAPDPLLRLGVLCLGNTQDPADGTRSGSDAETLARHLHMSNKERARLSALAHAADAMSEAADGRALRAAVYRFGRQAASDGLLARAAWAVSGDVFAPGSREAERLGRVLSTIESWPVPKLPFKGSDLAALGVLPGPLMGEILKRFEDWWVAEDFPEDKDRLSAQLARMVSQK